jgi:hypothetical protein
VIETEGVADRHEPVTDSDVVGISERRDSELMVCGGLDERKICLGIFPYNLRLVFLSIFQNYFYIISFFNYMVVGNYKTVFTYYKTRPQAMLPEFLLWPTFKKFFKKILKRVILPVAKRRFERAVKRRLSLFNYICCAYVNNRWLKGFDQF